MMLSGKGVHLVMTGKERTDKTSDFFLSSLLSKCETGLFLLLTVLDNITNQLVLKLIELQSEASWTFPPIISFLS
jgi:hypothetical protein